MSQWHQDVEKGSNTQATTTSLEGEPGAGPPGQTSNNIAPSIATSSTTAVPSALSSPTKSSFASKTDETPGSFACFGRLRLRFPKTSKSHAPRKPKIKVRKIHEQPRGYGKLATFLDCDENFMMYRRFGYLQSRLLLEKQDELARYERELDNVELDEHDGNDQSLMTRQNHRDVNTSKKAQLFRNIEQAWNDYCVLVANAAKMQTLNKPTSAEHESVLSFLINVKPVLASEAGFIQHREDLIILRPGREYSWLDSAVEKVLRWPGSSPIQKWFKSEDTLQKSDGSDGSDLYTRSRIEKFVLGIIAIFVLILLIVPIYVLYDLTSKNDTKTSFGCIGVLLVATVAFTACTSLFTSAKRYEILAASAAYCAVLVVFIGNVGQHYPNSNSQN